MKQLNYYRKEVFDHMKTNPRRSLRRLLQLSAAYIACNAGADYLKNLVLNRDSDPGDMLVDNIARLFGFSKWSIYEARSEGIGTAVMKTILPPAKSLDAAAKDVRSVYKYYADGKEIKGFELPGSVPLAGKFYYWWFGKGSVKTQEKRLAKARAKRRKFNAIINKSKRGRTERTRSR